MEKISNLTIKKEITFNDEKLYSKKIEKALKEGKIIEKEYKERKRKGYKNVDELLSSMLDN